MADKVLNSRIIHKHDIEANWLKATNFIPKQGELIVYDIDDSHNYERFKIGDGVTNVNNLIFIVETITPEQIAAVCGVTIYNARKAVL